MILPHLRGPMGQQKIESQEEALEIAMKLEVALREDAQFGALHIQIQLEAMQIEIQNLRKYRGKEASAYIWCIFCRSVGHTKDQCTLFSDYLQVGGPNPLHRRDAAGPSNPKLWCANFSIVGQHDTNHYLQLGAYVPEMKQQWCRFYSSVGHKEHNCRMYELMIDRLNLYRVQEDPLSPASPSG